MNISLEHTKELNLAQSNTLLDTLDYDQLRFYKGAALFSYVLAYFYSEIFFNSNLIYYFPLSVGLIGVVELLNHVTNRPFTQAMIKNNSFPETIVFMFATLAQALALSIWGPHPQFEAIQFIALHMCFIFYVASRNGALLQHRIGVMIWLDSFNHIFVLPTKNLFLRKKVLFTRTPAQQDSTKDQQTFLVKYSNLAFIAISIFFTLFLVNFVWSQLIQVSDKFASITENFSSVSFDWLRVHFNPTTLIVFSIQFILSIPVGMWLFGLMAGSSLSQSNHNAYTTFHQKMRSYQVFPKSTAYIVIGSLCFIYGLFFVVAMSEFNTLLFGVNATSITITPQEASSIAISGFWQLIRVSLLNFVVLGTFYVFAEKPLWDIKDTRLLLTCLFIFATCFALIAAWKLFGVYIYLYGLTPRRLLSGWFILVLLAWCILTTIRLYKPVQAIRLGVLYTVISFTASCYLYPVLIK